MTRTKRGLEHMVEEESRRKAKIVTIDIETSPIIAYSWGPVWDTNLIECIEQGRIMGYSAKWLGGKQETKVLPDYKGYTPGKLDDTEIVKDIYKVLDEADIVIGHNSNKFDIKYINSRFLAQNLPPPSPYKSIDTCTVARRYLKLPSYKLDDIGKYFNIGQKLSHAGFSLWKKCMKGQKTAWRTMKRYNAQDVRLTEMLYLKLRPYIHNHPNLGTFSEDVSCPKCQGYNFQWRGYSKTASSVFKRFRCNDCGGWGRVSIREKGYSTTRNAT